MTGGARERVVACRDCCRQVACKPTGRPRMRCDECAVRVRRRRERERIRRQVGFYDDREVACAGCGQPILVPARTSAHNVRLHSECEAARRREHDRIRGRVANERRKVRASGT